MVGVNTFALRRLAQISGGYFDVGPLTKALPSFASMPLPGCLRLDEPDKQTRMIAEDTSRSKAAIPPILSSIPFQLHIVKKIETRTLRATLACEKFQDVAMRIDV